MRRIGVAIGVAMATTLVLGTVSVARATVDECRQMCRDTESNCVFDAHERGKVCEEGCVDTLQADYRTACLGDTVQDNCDTARDALRSCLTTCGNTARDDEGGCIRDRQDCVSTNCDPPPRPGYRPGRFYPGIRGRFHR